MAITISGSGITSANIADGTIVSGDISDTAAIPSSKLDHGTSANKMVRLDAGGKLPVVDGSNLTGLSTSIDAVATGALTAGSSVILKTDGTVEIVKSTTTTVSEAVPLGTGAEPVASTGLDVVAMKVDPNNAGKFVIGYRDGGVFKAMVGTTSGNTISFGSPSTIYSGNAGWGADLDWDKGNANTFVAVYVRNGANQNSSSNGVARVCTVSGNSISNVGGEQTFYGNYTNATKVACDPVNAGKVIVHYSDGGGNYRIKAKAGNISGTSISWGGDATLNCNNGDPTQIIYNSGKFIAVYKDHGAGCNYGNFWGVLNPGSVSGTSISLGSQTTYDSTQHANVGRAAFNTNTPNQFIVAFRDKGDNYYGKIRVGTFSGNSVSLGPEITFKSANVGTPCISFDKNSTNKFVLSYGHSSTTKIITGTLSDTSNSATVSWGTEHTLVNRDGDSYVDFDDNSTNKFYVVYRDASNYTEAVVCQMGGASTTTNNLTADNFIGFSDGAYADGATATILVNGAVSSDQSGLTTVGKYYVQLDGTITTTPGSPSVYAGLGLSATKLLIKG